MFFKVNLKLEEEYYIIIETNLLGENNLRIREYSHGHSKKFITPLFIDYGQVIINFA